MKQNVSNSQFHFIVITGFISSYTIIVGVIYIILLSVGLPDDRHVTGLAGILLLILQWPVTGWYFENQSLKPVSLK